MKKYIILFAVSLLAACTPAMKEADMQPVIPADQIEITITPTNVENVYDFTTNVTNLIVGWDLGNGSTSKSEKTTGSYPYKGDYTITLTVFSQGGMTVKTKVLNIESDNYELVKDPIFTMLSGGVEATEGKTWIIDATNKGHLGCGPEASYVSEWYNAAPMEKEDMGIYDDEIIFSIKDLKFQYINNGDTFVNGDAKGEATARGASILDDQGDAKMAYTVPAENWTWSIVKEGEKNFIVFPPAQGFAIYWTKEAHKYEILSINDDEMYLRTQLSEISWYIKLVRKGFERPIEPPKEKPYGSIDVECTFDSESKPGNLTWDLGESKSLTVVNNLPWGVNPSEKVAKYERGAAQWCALTADLAVNLDLTTRHVFKIKAYYPSTNAYNDREVGYTWSDSEDDQYFLSHLEKTITLRLQNAEISEPWTDQADITLKVEEFDKWVEYEFDFSEFKDRKTFDRIMLQFGGEPKLVDGIFFFDDLILLPAQ